MKRALMAVMAAVAVLGGTTTASAGVYADDLSRCLVSSTSDADSAMLVRWMFSSLSANPVLKAMTTVTEGQREAYNKAVAALFERLLTVDCRKPYVEALKYEGGTVTETSFGVLGGAAVRGLMNQKDVAAQLQKLSTYLDKNKFAALAKEAGVVTPSSAVTTTVPK
ncbi:MAG: hypothetical protein ACR2F8_12135 [Caulobacteraceae bacterium]